MSYPSSHLHWLIWPLDLDTPVPDPLSGVRLADSGGGTEPSKGRPGSTTTGGETAGAESGCWQGPAGDHHQVLEGHTG